MKKNIGLIMLLSFTLVLAACSSDKDQAKEVPLEEGQAPEVEISDEELLAEDDVVAIVNGEEILGEQYNSTYRERKEFEMYTKESDEEIDNEQVKKITIDGLVGQTLINQEMEKMKKTVSDEEVEAEFENIKSQEGDVLESLLEQFQWTEADLKLQIKNDLTNARFIQEKTDVKVTEDEVKSEYERVKKQTEKLPEFKDVKENIEVQLVKQKENQALAKIIEELKKDSKIEIKL